MAGCLISVPNLVATQRSINADAVNHLGLAAPPWVEVLKIVSYYSPVRAPGLQEDTRSVSWMDVVKATKPGSVCPVI